MTEQDKKAILHLVEGSRDAIVCSIDDEGFPAAKAMFRAKNDGIRTFWFSTNASSIRAGYFSARPQACIYFLDAATVKGVSLTGHIRVRTDAEARQMLWHDGDEKYYPKGVSDPDYCVLEFTAERGNYYHAGNKTLFSVDEIGG